MSFSTHSVGLKYQSSSIERKGDRDMVIDPYILFTLLLLASFETLKRLQNNLLAVVKSNIISDAEQ